jgi:short-subunit dehydrogenase
MPRPISDSVVVITGASSGIGRATALAFAERGAVVVLAARREGPLHELASECERAGGRALAMPLDVTDEGAVQELARRAIETFGRIDVWVNNAAVTLFGRFEETPPEAYRRVIETNLFGYIYGARAALPVFREQGSGMLVNVSSIVSKVAQPYTSAYGLTKAAIRSLGMSLREELMLDGQHDIHVCTVMPATIDTPFFQQAANYTGRAVKAMPPVYPAEEVAHTILSLAEKPQHEVFVGRSARMLSAQHTLAPTMAERMMAMMVDKQHLYGDRPADPTPGNLFEPMPQYASISGGWLAEEDRPPALASHRRTAILGVALGASLLALAFFASREETEPVRKRVTKSVRKGAKTAALGGLLKRAFS